MNRKYAVLFVSALAVTFCTSIGIHSGSRFLASGPQLDANYFTDADELKPPPGMDGEVNLERLPEFKRAFCARNQFDINQELIENPWARLSFQNPGGPFNKGECWWHSRLQRAAAYLAFFRPELPKPDAKQARKLVQELSAQDHVVEIPGYANLNTFSRDFEGEFKSVLTAWYMGDYFNAKFLMRFGDSSTHSPSEMRSLMESTYDRMFQQRRILFLRIQGESFGFMNSHALLLLDLQPLRGPGDPNNSLSALNPIGYKLKLIDSNYPGTVIDAEYRFGESNIKYCPDSSYPEACERFAPYTSFDGELFSSVKAVKTYCR